MFDTRSSEMQADPRGKQPVVPTGSSIMCNQKECKEIWKRPTSGWAKLNFDAGFSDNWGVGSWGAVLRNDKGEVLLSAWGLIQHVATAEAAEALAGMLCNLLCRIMQAPSKLRVTVVFNIGTEVTKQKQIHNF
jgi:hypothetical protein